MFMQKIPKEVQIDQKLSDEKLIELENFTSTNYPNLVFKKLNEIKNASGREKLE